MGERRTPFVSRELNDEKEVVKRGTIIPDQPFFDDDDPDRAALSTFTLGIILCFRVCRNGSQQDI